MTGGREDFGLKDTVLRLEKENKELREEVENLKNKIADMGLNLVEIEKYDDMYWKLPLDFDI